MIFFLNLIDEFKWKLAFLTITATIATAAITGSAIYNLRQETVPVEHEQVLSKPAPNVEKETEILQIVPKIPQKKQNITKAPAPKTPQPEQNVEVEEDFWYAEAVCEDTSYIIKKSQYDEFLSELLSCATPEEFFSPEKIEISPQTTRTVVHNAKEAVWNDELECEFQEWLEDEDDENDTDYSQTWELFLYEKGMYDPETGLLTDKSNVEEIEVEAEYREKTGYIDPVVKSNFDSILPQTTVYKVDPDSVEALQKTMVKYEIKPEDVLENDPRYKNPGLVKSGETLYEVALNNDGTTVEWRTEDAEVDAKTKSLLESNTLWEGDALFVEDASAPTPEKGITPLVRVRRVCLGPNKERIESTYEILRSDILDILSPLGSNTSKNQEWDPSKAETLQDFFDSTPG